MLLLVLFHVIMTTSLCVTVTRISMSPVRHQCNTLFKSLSQTISICVEVANKVYYPNQVYCYMPLYNYLDTLLKRPGFVVNGNRSER